MISLIFHDKTDVEKKTYNLVKWEPGQEVAIRTIGCRGFVTGVMVREGGFLGYEVSYFLGDSYHRVEFSEYQLEGVEG